MAGYKRIEKGLIEKIVRAMINPTKTKNVNFLKSKLSIFCPAQIRVSPLAKVAVEYINPKFPWVKLNSFLICSLNKDMKNVCPKLEKNIKTKPKIRRREF
tara:strand:+ start:11373 stop:11672 length:300 start_codon:yes stop_codon:yes gene_type:complete